VTSVAEDLDLAALLAAICPGCEWPACPVAALYVAWWSEPCCDKARRATLLCDIHGEMTEALAAQPDTRILCDHCGSERQLERLEPLR
jgi:hypothetical protein